MAKTIKWHSGDSAKTGKMISTNSGWRSIPFKKYNSYFPVNQNPEILVESGKPDNEKNRAVRDFILFIISLSKHVKPRFKIEYAGAGAGGCARSPPAHFFISTAFLFLFSLLFFVSSCDRNIAKPLGNEIVIQDKTAEGYKFCGDSIKASAVPAYRPVSEVTVKVTKPDGKSLSTETLKDPDGDGIYSKSLITDEYGNWTFDFTCRSGMSTTKSQVIQRVNMNEAQSDAALESAVKELGTSKTIKINIGEVYSDYGGTPLTDFSDNEIMDYFGPNFTEAGYTSDLCIGVKKSPPTRGPPSYEYKCIIDVQGSNTDALDSNKKSLYNSLDASCYFFEPVVSIAEIKAKLTEKKFAGWVK